MEQSMNIMGSWVLVVGDMSLFALLAIGSLVLGFVIGRFRLIHLLLHAYIAFAVVMAIPAIYLRFSLYGEALVLLGILVLLTFLGDRIFDIHARPSVYGWIPTFILGFLVSGLLIGMFLRVLPDGLFPATLFSGRTLMYFVGDVAFLVWLAIPLFFLVFLNNRR